MAHLLAIFILFGFVYFYLFFLLKGGALNTDKFSNIVFMGSVAQNEKKTVVVSLSPQSIISLAVKYKIGIDQMARKLGTFMRSIGVHYVFDTVFARKLALTEIANEFVSRFKVCV